MKRNTSAAASLTIGLGAGLATAGAAAHPGHGAPLVHAHSLTEVGLILAAILAGAFATWRLLRKRRQDRKTPR